MRGMLTPLAVAFAALVAGAANAAPASDPCQTAGACRAVGEISIPVGGRMKSIKIGRTLPWIAENNAMLFPGDVVVVSFPEGQEGQLPMTLVATGEAAKSRTLGRGELRFDFQVRDNSMTLVVESGHASWLHYMAVMVTSDGKPHKTSICPVMAGKMAFEMWPHGIIQLALTNFTPVKAGEMTCR